MLEGEIKQINLVERLVGLWRDRFTGAIRFENDGIIKIIYFKDGDILSASTNDRADSVDEILMRAGKVSKEHVKQALAKRKENETLGDALLNLGFITRKELMWARRIQVINVVRSVEEWGGGSFTIVADYLPKREEGTQYPLPQIVVEKIVTDQDRAKFEKLLDSGAAVYERTPGEDDTFRKLGLNEDAEAIMAHVDGEKTASEVAAASRQDSFNAFKLLHALTLLGVLRKSGASAVPAAAAGLEGMGVSDAADVWGTPSGANFQLDDSPASSSFSMSDDVSPVPGLADPASSFAVSDASAAFGGLEPTPSRPVPGWDAPPVGASSVIAPSPEPPAEAAEEPRWGFDEAQIEAAQKVVPPPAPLPPPVRPAPPIPAATPKTDRPRVARTVGEGTMNRRPRPAGEATMTRRPVATTPVKESKSRYGLLLLLMILFIVAGIGYFGYAWVQGRGDGAANRVAATTTNAPAATQTSEQTITAAVGGTETQTGTTAPPAPVVTPPAPQRPVETATVAPRPQPAPVAVASKAPPASGDRARYDDMARTFAQSPNANFAVQFAIVCEPSNVTKALRSNGAGEVWFIPIRVKERGCYRMFWGRFGTREEATAAMSRMPGELRETRPAVVTVPR